jgi:hypothetical protein
MLSSDEEMREGGGGGGIYSVVSDKKNCRPVAREVQVGTMHPTGIWKISNTNKLISPLQKRATPNRISLLNSRGWKKLILKKCMCMPYILCSVTERNR